VTYFQKVLIPSCVLLCALCEMGCLPSSTQPPTTSPGTPAPRITSAQASNEFPHLGSDKVQIEVHGDGFTPSAKALLTVGSRRISVIINPAGSLDSVTIGSLACGAEVTASARDANGLQSNSFAFQVYCI
jgi:hypothetical protein